EVLQAFELLPLSRLTYLSINPNLASNDISGMKL
ncbi:unnamed protein product, partial [marine sediment metagenome]